MIAQLDTKTVLVLWKVWFRLENMYKWLKNTAILTLYHGCG